MTTDTFQRKLIAILSADVVGYSRLMGEDEEATVCTLNKYKQIIFDLIKRHNGRLIDSPGDNVLADFISVVDAVRCGVQIQEDLKENNEGLPTNRKMDFRVGINTGDVIQDGDRIYGDGVNVAARLESLADPGGIWPVVGLNSIAAHHRDRRSPTRNRMRSSSTTNGVRSGSICNSMTSGMATNT